MASPLEETQGQACLEYLAQGEFVEEVRHFPLDEVPRLYVAILKQRLVDSRQD
jgi:hypothetical protein